MSHRWRVLVVVGTAVIAGCGLLLPGVAQAKGGPQASYPTSGPVGDGYLTDAQVAAMSPAAQARRLAPLRSTAAAAAAAGKSRDADTYSNVYIDANNQQVDVYLTDPSHSSQVILDAQRFDRSIDPSIIRFWQAAYTSHSLHVARADLLRDATGLPYAVYSVAVAPNGSSLQVTVDKPNVARNSVDQPLANLTGESVASLVHHVALTFIQGHAPTAHDNLSWANYKWEDIPPFIGGDTLLGNDPQKPGYVDYCTAGLPAVRISNGQQVMITAGHCYGLSTAVYTGAGTSGGNSGVFGHYVGTQVGYIHLWDAEELVGATNNSDESDASGWIPTTSDAYSL